MKNVIKLFHRWKNTVIFPWAIIFEAADVAASLIYTWFTPSQPTIIFDFSFWPQFQDSLNYSMIKHAYSITDKINHIVQCSRNDHTVFHIWGAMQFQACIDLLQFVWELFHWPENYFSHERCGEEVFFATIEFMEFTLLLLPGQHSRL